MQYNVGAKIVSQLQNGQETYVGTSSGAIHCLDWSKSQFTNALFTHNGPISALTMFNGVITSGGWDRKVIIHQNPQIVIEGFNDAIKAVLGTDEFLFVGTADGYLYKYDKSNQKLLQKQTNKRFIESIILLPGNLIATAGSDRTIRVFDFDLNQKSQLELINSIKKIVFSDDLLFVTCAEKLIRVFELPDVISGRNNSITDFQEIFSQKLSEWGLDLAVPKNWKSDGIYVACADRTLKCVKRDEIIVVPSGASDIVQGVDIVQSLVKVEEKEKLCSMIVYSSHDGHIRRIFMHAADRQFFVPEAKVEEKSMSMEDSDFEDENIQKIQQERLKKMLKDKAME